MHRTITRAEAIQMIAGTAGQEFGVRFIKRTTGVERRMRARVEPANKSDSSHGLIPVHDLEKDGRRTIPIEGILSVSVGGRVYEIEE